MSEAPRDYAEQQQEIIGNVVQRMKLLHAQSRGEKSDEERISEGMSNQIMGATTQRAHQVLIEHETHHRSQLCEYLRQIGLEPPPLFGLHAEKLPR